jgi:hypothetical protein
MKMKSSLMIALFIGAVGSYSGYAFENDANTETQMSAEQQQSTMSDEVAPDQGLNLNQNSEEMDDSAHGGGGGSHGGGGGSHGGGGGGSHGPVGGGNHGGGGSHGPVGGGGNHGGPVGGDHGGGNHGGPGDHGGGGEHGGGGFHPAPGHPGQGWPDHGGFHDGHGWHPGEGMGHIHYDPIGFHHGGYYWPHWDRPYWVRPIFYWNWATLHAVTCVSEDSVGDQYTVTEDGYSGLIYQSIVQQVEDASIDRCYAESGNDPGCHLESCTPLY